MLYTLSSEDYMTALHMERDLTKVWKYIHILGGMQIEAKITVKELSEEIKPNSAVFMLENLPWRTAETCVIVPFLAWD